MRHFVVRDIVNPDNDEHYAMCYVQHGPFDTFEEARKQMVQVITDERDEFREDGNFFSAAIERLNKMLKCLEDNPNADQVVTDNLRFGIRSFK